MAKMKVWMRTFDKADRLLFMRTIGSTIVGEGVDTLIFISIAFIGTMPVSVVVQLIIVQYICKVIIEILMTPVTYWIVKKAKQVEGVDAIGAESYNPIIIMS
jgi:uncharacterized integral membrane protein (TIGR00697 family)